VHIESGEELSHLLDSEHARMCEAQLGMFRLIAEMDRCDGWRDAGARDLAHWLAMRYGISNWKAQRWIAAAHGLEGLPAIATALRSGELGPDKVVELTRLATPETEAELIRWARSVSSGAIRRRAERAERRSLDDVRSTEESRSCSWWFYDDGRRVCVTADLPASRGMTLIRAVNRGAERVPVMPGEEDEWGIDARRADALVALAAGGLARDPDSDRSTVVVHTSLQALAAGEGSEIEEGGIAHPETVHRLMCSGRVQLVIEDEAGNPVRIGRMRREPSPWMMRQLRHRDPGCRFPGCGTRSFANAHHVRWWSRGGPTDLDNLLLVCSFHHRLVHEYGWSIRLQANGDAAWFRPDGSRYRSGPAPPLELTPAEDIAEAGDARQASWVAIRSGGWR